MSSPLMLDETAIDAGNLESQTVLAVHSTMRDELEVYTLGTPRRSCDLRAVVSRESHEHGRRPLTAAAVKSHQFEIVVVLRHEKITAEGMLCDVVRLEKGSAGSDAVVDDRKHAGRDMERPHAMIACRREEQRTRRAVEDGAFRTGKCRRVLPSVRTVRRHRYPRHSAL